MRPPLLSFNSFAAYGRGWLDLNVVEDPLQT